MTEEVKQEVKQEVKTEVKEEVKQEAALDPFEARATDQGWKPLEDWTAAGNDPAEWRDARAFLDRGEILSRVSQQNKEIKELRKTLKAFEEHNKQLAESKYKEKLTELRGAKKEALEAGDAARVVQLDEQIDMVRDAQAENKASATIDLPPEVPQEFQTWMDRNSWYGQNDEMRMFADNVGTAFAKTNRTKSPAEVLKYVETRVKKAYPDMFQNPARSAPSKVEGGEGTRRAQTSKSQDIDLPPEAISVMNTLVRGGVMTKEEYIKQYKLKS